MERKKKEEVVAQLKKDLTESDAVFLTNFQGLSVEKMSALRRKVDGAGGRYQVAKNTLVKIAAKGTPAEVIGELLVGCNALSITNGDPAALAKALIDFAKENDKLEVRGGALSGRLLGFEQVKAMADLPSREILLATMLGAMNAVPGGFVRVLAAVPQTLLYALSAIRDAKETAAA